MATANDTFHFSGIQLSEPAAWAPIEAVHFDPLPQIDVAVPTDIPPDQDGGTTGDPITDDTPPLTDDQPTVDIQPDPQPTTLTDDEIALMLTPDTVTTVDGTDVYQDYLPTEEVQPTFHITATATVDMTVV
jgi:hypothetical protein